MLNRCKIILIIFLLLQLGCSGSTAQKKSFLQKLTTLNVIYHDSLRTQHGGLTIKFIYKWGDRYWDLVTEEPNNTLAPVAAKKAFDIYKKLKNSNLYEKKLNDLSINDRAMSRILPYWNDALWNGEDYTPATHPYPQKLQAIAQKSKSIPVQIAAHYYLAQWYTKFKYYRLARNQLNVLDLSY